MNRAKTILIVDDERDVANFLANFFRKKGYVVFTAYSGQEAVQQAKVLCPDLLILDLIMPDICGSEVAAQLLSHAPLKDIQIIFMTGKLVDLEESTVNIIGDRYLLKKPFEAEKILKIVHNLIGPAPDLKSTIHTTLIKFLHNTIPHPPTHHSA